MDQSNFNLVENIISNQVDWFEIMVLGCLLKDYDFYKRVRDVLCVDALTGKPVKDFQADADNALYKIIHQYYGIVKSKHAPQMDVRFADAALISESSQRDGIIGPSEIQLVMDRLAQAQAIDISTSMPMVKEGFVYWLSKFRMTRITQEMTTQNTLWNPRDVLAAVKQQLHSVGIVDGEETFFSFAHSIDNSILDVIRTPIPGLKNLTRVMGGGFGQKEGTLFVGGEGSGKTILSCQLGCDLAMHANKVGIIISTEQGHEELVPRCVSNLCNIPYNRIMDKFDPRLLTTDIEKQRYAEMRAGCDGKLFWEDWNRDDRGRSVEKDLRDLISQRQDQIGKKIDFIILDWIGGALGKLNQNNMDKLRVIYQISADAVAHAARDLNMFTIAFAQATSGACVNKRRIDSTMIGECKGMGKNFTNVIGITALFVDEQMPDGDEQPIYAPRQFFYASKGRKGKGGFTSFLRQFEYQRMVDVVPGGVRA
jgi:replicative DNA helicase